MRRLLSVLAVLLVLLIAADRITVAVVSRTVAARLQASAALQSEPQVDIAGFPFLTQAISGRYDHVTVKAGSVSRGGVRLSSFDVELSGVQIPLSSALSNSVTTVPVDGLTATAVVTYADVASVGFAGVSVTALGDGVRVTGRITVLGQSVTAAADSTVRLDGRSVVITAQRVRVLGQSNSLLNSALRGRLDFRVPIGSLPYKLVLQSVHASAAGLVLTARAGPTVLPARAP